MVESRTYKDLSTISLLSGIVLIILSYSLDCSLLYIRFLSQVYDSCKIIRGLSFMFIGFSIVFLVFSFNELKKENN